MNSNLDNLIEDLADLFSKIPKSTGRKLGYIAGRLWFALGKKHRKMAVYNLTKIYGDKLSKKEIFQLARKNFIFHAVTFFEIVRLKRLTPEEVMNEVEEVEGLENYLEAKKSGKPIFILSAHFGNWELMALAAPILMGHPIDVIARKLDFGPLDKVIKKIRVKTGNRVIDKKQNANMIRNALKEKHTIGILPDQRALTTSSVIVPFMGIPAKTNKGLAMFDLRYKPEIVPVFSYRLKNGKYKIKILPMVKRPKRSDLAEDVVKYTAIYNEVISKEIYENPDHWFWFHDRWVKKGKLFK